MAGIEILGSGRLDERESAFPQAVQLPDGDLLCSFSVGGGQYAEGGTDWARSQDGGLTWELEGTILPPTDSPPTTNFLKLSLAKDGKTIYAYGTRAHPGTSNRFGEKKCEAIFCRSDDGGRSWSVAGMIGQIKADRFEQRIRHACVKIHAEQSKPIDKILTANHSYFSSFPESG